MITIKRKKSFIAGFIPFRIIINCWVNEYKKIITSYQKLVNDSNEESKTNLSINQYLEDKNIKYLSIKNGKEINIDNKNIKSIFICFNEENTKIYSFTYTEEIKNFTDNQNFLVYPKFHFSKNELILKDEK